MSSTSRSVADATLVAARRCGHEHADLPQVGVLYNPALAPVLADEAILDVVGLIPETLWHEDPTEPRYRPIGQAIDAFDLLAAGRPTVLHGIGLSIGSDRPLDTEHLDWVAAAIDRYDARWYSEHLAAFRVEHGPGVEGHAGVGLPIPFDDEVLEALVTKVTTVVERLDVPFLLENSAIYVEVPDQSMTEAGFLNRLCGATGAGVLLDLHNLVVNETNLGWDGLAYLDELDLRHVREIHLAGGEMVGAWYTDAHSGTCPDRVWELLGAVLPRATELGLVTFEIHESRVPVIGMPAVAEQLARVRAAIEGA